jgi:hypothetical protein
MASKPNVIFLDIDGVLCNPRACLATRNDGFYSYLDPIACLLVKRMCDDLNAKLVISSSWRLNKDLDYMQSVLSAACPKLGEYIWCSQTWWRTTSHVFTNDSGNCNRGLEIKHWLDNHPSEYNRFAILDDNSDMGPVMDCLVLTDAYDGVGFNDYFKVEKLLRGEEEF